MEEPVPLDPPEPVLGISQPSPRPEVKALDPPTCSPLRRPSAIRTVDIEDETILSLGSEPIELRLTTPPPSRSTQVPRPATSTTTNQKPRSSRDRRSPRRPYLTIPPSTPLTTSRTISSLRQPLARRLQRVGSTGYAEVEVPPSAMSTDTINIRRKKTGTAASEPTSP